MVESVLRAQHTQRGPWEEAIGYHDFRSQGVKRMEASQQQIRLYVASLPSEPSPLVNPSQAKRATSRSKDCALAHRRAAPAEMNGEQ